MAESKDASGKNPVNEVTLQPALRQIGTTQCPICQTRVAVFLTEDKSALCELQLLLGASFLQRAGVHALAQEKDETG